MSNSPNPIDKNMLLRSSAAGVGLSILGIVLFVVLWLALSSLENAPRLFVAMCVPPLVIAGIVIVYRLAKGSPSA
jgi:hypothetical protein